MVSASRDLTYAFGLFRQDHTMLFLVPFLMKKPLYSMRLANLHFWAHLVGGIGMGACMGTTGLKGMLRWTLHTNGENDRYMILALICGALLLIGFLAFFLNIVMTVGLEGVSYI